MANAEPGYHFAKRFAARIAGADGPAFIDLATATTRSVAQGVLGIALIQAGLAGFGMLVVGVPAAGLWALFVLILAIVQLPPLLVLAPVIAWVFGDADTGYGNAINAQRTVLGCAQAGLACVMIEDQSWPKRCGHTEGKEVVDREEALRRIRACVRAREEHGLDHADRAGAHDEEGNVDA